MAEYKINYTQSNFTGGIIAAELYGRNDFNKVKAGLKKCTNWTIREAGGLEFRRGTKFMAKIPVNAGIRHRMASLSDRLFLFGTNFIIYLNSSNEWVTLNYPSGITPNLNNLDFTELNRKLYYYDGTMKLCEIYLDSSNNYTPATRITKFEQAPTGATLTSAIVGNAPSVVVNVWHEYTFALAKDEKHESVRFSGSTSQYCNTELGEGVTTTQSADNPSQRVDVTATLTSAQATEYNGGKILFYKKYQGEFYFISSQDISAGTTQYKFYDKGQESVDTSKTPKENPGYIEDDGSITKLNSIADYNQRLFLTRTGQEATTIIYSEVGNIESLAYSSQRNEDEAGYLELPISNYDSWCKVVSGLDLILSTSYTISKVSGIGELTTDTILWDGLSKTVNPVRTRRSVIYTNGCNRNIYDLTYNEYGQYDSVDLTLLVKYIFEQKTIKRLAFKDYPIKTIYVLCDDGDLYCLTYIKDQNIYAWYKIEHSDKIEDICVINTDTEDDVYLIVNYDGKYVVEKAYHKTEDSGEVYMDCVKRVTLTNENYDGSEITLPTDLADIFNGKRVRVFDLGNNKYYGDYDIQHPKVVAEGGRVVEIDDLDFDGFLVEDGKIQVGQGIFFSGDLLIGLPYYAVMETIPLEFQDSNGNSTIGRKKTINEAFLRYGDSRGISYKTQGHEYDCGTCDRDAVDNAQFLERGQLKLYTTSEYKWDSTIKILQRQPYPARIESITLGLTFNDKS